MNRATKDQSFKYVQSVQPEFEKHLQRSLNSFAVGIGRNKDRTGFAFNVTLSDEMDLDNLPSEFQNVEIIYQKVDPPAAY